MKTEDKKRLVGRPCTSKRHDKSHIKDKQPEDEICNANEIFKSRMMIQKKFWEKELK